MSQGDKPRAGEAPSLYSLHSSYFILAAERPAVGLIEWLGLTHMRVR